MKQISNIYYSKFIRKEKIGLKTFNFYFEKNKDFRYFPGQYIKIFLNHENPDNRGTSRYFTLSSSPKDNYLRISTRVLKSSFKKELKSLRPFEIVKIFGPVGYFDFKNDKNSKIFIAGGIGVTPFISLLSSFNKLNSKIILINSYSSDKDVLFKNELESFRVKFSNFNYLIPLSDKSNKNRVDAAYIIKHCPDYLKSNFFIVGSIDFENYVYKEVKEIGVDENKIFKENFTDL